MYSLFHYKKMKKNLKKNKQAVKKDNGKKRMDIFEYTRKKKQEKERRKPVVLCSELKRQAAKQGKKRSATDGTQQQQRKRGEKGEKTVLGGHETSGKKKKAYKYTSTLGQNTKTQKTQHIKTLKNRQLFQAPCSQKQAFHAKKNITNRYSQGFLSTIVCYIGRTAVNLDQLLPPVTVTLTFQSKKKNILYEYTV